MLTRIPDSGRRHRLHLARASIAALIITLTASIFDAPEVSYAFETTLETSVNAQTKVYLDRGANFSEVDSVADTIKPGINQVSLPLPPGEFRSLRFDPIDREGQVGFSEIRIIGPGGKLIRRIKTGVFIPNNQFEPPVANGGALQLRTKPGVNDPYLTAYFSPSLQLPAEPLSRYVTPRWSMIGWFAGSLTCLLIAAFVWQQRSRWGTPIIRFAHRRPRLAMALCAITVAITSSYPVVFFGKSFLSAGTGILLLYEQRPTVPGYTDTRLDDARGADVGALHWAHMPYTVLLGRAIWEEAAIPLWNRYNSAGVTLLGQGQSMIGDPLNFLVAIVGGNAWAFDVKFVLCKALFAFGLGWCVWLITRDLAASLIVIAAGAFVAFFNYRVNHPAIFSVSYSPWILAGWLQAIRATDNRSLVGAIVLWFIAGWMLLSSGTVKEAYLLFAALNLTGAIVFLLQPVPIRHKFRRAIPLALAGVAFVFATAPMWWTFLDALKSARTNYDTPLVFQIPRAWLIGFFEDLFYLESIPGRSVYNPSANFLILLGCLCAIAQPRRLFASHFAPALLLGLLAALAVAFSWIPQGWILGIPFLRNVHQVSIHFSCIAIIHAAVLAGWGFSNARGPLTAGRPWRFITVFCGFLVPALYAYFTSDPLRWTGGRGVEGWMELIPQHGFFYANLALLLLALISLAFIASRRLRGRPLNGIWLLGALFALTVILGRHGLHLPLETPTRFIRSPGLRPDLLAPSPATEFLGRAVAAEPGRIIGTGNTLMTGFTAIYGFEGINGPDAIFNPHYREILDAAQWIAPRDWRFALQPPALPSWRPLLDFFNVRYIGTPVGTALETTFHRKVASLDLDVYHGETTWPRAFFVDRLESYQTPTEFLTLLNQRAPGQPFAAVQADDPAAPASPAGLAVASAATFEQATDYKLTSNTTEFTVTAPGPGFVALHETWLADDFRATLNGRRVPYFRVNHAFKGIAVPSAGVHRIAFTYWPRHFTESLVMCAAGFLILTLLLLVLRRGWPALLAVTPAQTSTSSTQTPSS